MDLTQTDTMSVPTYIIYRDIQPGEPYDPTASPVFYPPKHSDELFDALRMKYPHIGTHSERMRNAVIEFLLEEREAEALAAATASLTPDIAATQSMEDSASPWMHQSWPSMSSTTLSSPDMSSLGTPAYTNSPNLGTIQSKENSPMSLDRMTGVFSLSTSLQPKQRLRRKMTEAEKAEYRQRRLMKACDKCAKRKRKCTHNQLPAEASSSKSAKPAKTSVPASQHETAAAAAGSGINHQEVQDAAAQASSQAGPSHGEEGFNDFTLLLDEPMPDIDYSEMFNDFSGLDNFDYFTNPHLFNGGLPNAHSPPGRALYKAVAHNGTPESLAETVPFPQHLLGPFDYNGLPTHISPTLLDTATRSSGQIRLHTLQDQLRNQHNHLENLQDNAQTMFQHIDNHHQFANPHADSSHDRDAVNHTGTADFRHYTLAPGRHPSRTSMSTTFTPANAIFPHTAQSFAATRLQSHSCSPGVSTSSGCCGLSMSLSSPSSSPTTLSSSSASREGAFMSRSHLGEVSTSTFAGGESTAATSSSSNVSTSSPSSHGKLSPLSVKSIERRSISTELFMLRRRISPLSPRDLSPLLCPNSTAFHVNPLRLGSQLAARAQLARCFATSAASSSASPEQHSDGVQLESLQHVGRLSDHVRYRDHHGRRVSQTALQVICGMLLLVWLSSSPASLAVVAASAMALLASFVSVQRAASGKSASSLSREVKKLAWLSSAPIMV